MKKTSKREKMKILRSIRIQSSNYIRGSRTYKIRYTTSKKKEKKGQTH